MSLASGKRLGPYDIVSALGAGGMGEVYRARDPRLDRIVAIKILPRSFAEDATRLRRFEQEARAVAALNHPNILAIYDVGTEDKQPYIVSELLEGESLRERLRSGPIPARKAIDYASQMARGLAAAHSKGIIHRDLKPENVVLTREGRVKILDFGLAKLTESKDATEDATRTIQSEAGTVLGTVGYMSPEQVRGKPTDGRSDLFSLGAILHEMLSGKRAFHGDTTADTMTAILTKEPPELTETDGHVTPALEHIVRHCLEKNPDERAHSAHDVAFDLESLTTTSVGTKAVEAKPRRWHAVIAVMAGIALVAAGLLAGRRLLGSHQRSPEFHRLTFKRGALRMARFAPDGETVVYGAAWDGNPVELFTTRYDSNESRPLGVGHAQLLSVSKKGEIALLLNPLNVGFIQVGTLARMPLNGGAPRELLDRIQFAEWSPDGNSMAVVRLESNRLIAAQAAGHSTIEYPVGKVIYDGNAWIGHVRISPDDKYLALAQHIHGGDDGRLVIIERDGKKRFESQLFSSLQGVAWRPDGKEVWFTAAPTGGARAIYAVDLAGRQRLVLRIPGTMLLQDIAANGRLLLSTENARQQTFGLAPGQTKERSLSWLDWSAASGISPDGKTVLLSETGEGVRIYAAYLRPMDGSPAVRVGDGLWPDLSPDGKWVVLRDFSDPPQLVLWPTGTGEPRPVTHDKLTHLFPHFTPDGKAVVFLGRAPQSRMRAYFQALGGGEPVAITPEDSTGSGTTGLMTISPDGAYLVAGSSIAATYALYPIHGGEPRLLKGVDEREAVLEWSTDGKYLFTFRRGELPISIYTVDVTTGKRELFKQTAPPDSAGIEDVIQVRITRDGRAYLYSCFTVLSDLYVVEGLL
jgi:eukaryotic-like serine/threonine-protein kinase